MSTHITASGAQEIGLADGIEIVPNKDLTGTITVTNAGSTQYGTSSGTIAVITNPTAAGKSYRFTGLRTQGVISINPSGTTDITVNRLGPGQ